MSITLSFSINVSGPSFDDYDDESEGSGGDDLSDDYYGNYVDENTDYNAVDDNRPGGGADFGVVNPNAG